MDDARKSKRQLIDELQSLRQQIAGQATQLSPAERMWRDQIEQRLRESEENYRQLFEASADAVLLIDNQSGRLLEANAAACSLYGYDREDILLLRNTDLSAEPDVTQAVTTTTPVVREQIVTIPLRWHRKKDGTKFPVEIAGRFFVREGRPVHIAAIRDISRRLEDQDALRESERRLRFALDGANDGLWDVQLTTGRVYLSPRGCEILGYHPDEMQAVAEVWSQLVHPDDLPATQQRLTAHLEGRAALFEIEQRLRTKQGGWKWVLARGKVVERDEEGRPSRMTGTHTDITIQRNMEDQLRQSQKMESVGRLAGGVAHDFNNMLGVILGHTELALEQVDAELPLHADLLEIQRAATRSADLTRQLLAFARRQTIMPRVLDLNEAVDGMLKMLRRLIGENIALEWSPGPHLPDVKIDPSQISQILANLCVNARDAIASVGTVTISTSTEAFDASYCADHRECTPGRYLMLAVGDTGHGMSSEVMTHLFEPFFTTKGLGEGTGLGLATVYGVVKQNGGFVDVESTPGQGSTFRIYLPEYVGKAANSPVESGTATAEGGRETVLLVEDEPAILNLSKRLLDRLGYTVLAAGTPGEAIALAEKYPDDIQLLIADVVMPEMNGRDLAKRVMSLYPNIKRIFMSGYTADVIAHHGVLEEDVHFLQKPFSSKTLATKIREALGRN